MVYIQVLDLGFRESSQVSFGLCMASTSRYCHRYHWCVVADAAKARAHEQVSGVTSSIYSECISRETPVDYVDACEMMYGETLQWPGTPRPGRGGEWFLQSLPWPWSSRREGTSSPAESETSCVYVEMASGKTWLLNATQMLCCELLYIYIYICVYYSLCHGLVAWPVGGAMSRIVPCSKANSVHIPIMYTSWVRWCTW